MPDCVHHWRIDEPNGALSLGVCHKCGAARHFSNSGEIERGSYGRLERRQKAARKGRAAVRLAKERAMSGLEW